MACLSFSLVARAACFQLFLSLFLLVSAFCFFSSFFLRCLTLRRALFSLLFSVCSRAFLFYFFFFFYLYGDHRDLHSFPTRRSSDLVTVNHVLGVEMVLPDGELVTLGGKHLGMPGPDLLGLVTGSEGTFGIISKIICRLTPNPEKAVTMLGIYKSVHDACESVSSIIRHGIIPAAMEMLDKITISAVEKALKPGFPLDAEAVLIVELDGLADGLDAEAEVVEKLLKDSGATTVNRARDEVERAKIWRARKEAFGAIGQISPSYYVQDGVIPRSKLPEVLDEIAEIGKRNGLTVANVFHAGDGNLHPLILYDYENEQEVEKAHLIGEEILSSCIRHGGTLSGEHGIGLEKAEWMSELYPGNSLDNMKNVRTFFNPENLLNPGKIFPSPGRCAESKSGTTPKNSAVLNKSKMVAAKSGISV